MEPHTLNIADQGKILLIDDDTKSCEDLKIILGFLGQQVTATDSGNWQAAVAEQFESPSQIKLALIGPFSTEILQTLIDALALLDQGLPVVILSLDDSAKNLPESLLNAVTATIPYPLSHQPVLDALHKAEVYRQHYRRLSEAGNVRDYNMFRSLVGKSDEVQHIRHVMGQVADKEVTILITGESGTGKEVVARNLHMNSQRAHKPFVPINCGAIPPDLLESELFGHEKGAFTGAISTRIGRFEMAEGGTLFLDEIGDMPLPMQVKLLRAIQEKAVRAVGGQQELIVDVRILCATHKDLAGEVAAGRFRQDLYYRLNVIELRVPALRERREDIALLAGIMLKRLADGTGLSPAKLDDDALEKLKSYRFPGNVRELENMLERAYTLCEDDRITTNDLRLADSVPISENGEANLAQIDNLEDYLEAIERKLIMQALEETRWNRTAAAQRLGLSFRSMRYRLKKLGID